jgi:hypothetical protein
MTIFAVGLGLFQYIRIRRTDAVGALVIKIDNFLMRKFFLGKRRLDMALIGAINDFGDWFVRNFGDVEMTVTAFNIAVDAFIVNAFIDIIIPSPAVFIDSAAESMFVAHETVVFIGGGCLGAVEEG